MEILKRIPEESRKKLVAKGFAPQDGYVMQYLPVPPNCLSVPEISDGVTVMSMVGELIRLHSLIVPFDYFCMICFITFFFHVAF